MFESIMLSELHGFVHISTSLFVNPIFLCSGFFLVCFISWLPVCCELSASGAATVEHVRYDTIKMQAMILATKDEKKVKNFVS